MRKTKIYPKKSKEEFFAEFGCGESNAMKYYLVPVNKLRLAEGQAGKARGEEKKSWARVEELFKNSASKESASVVISMLKELAPVSLRNGIVLLNNDMKTAVGAHQLIKNLSDTGAATPAVERFLKRLRELDPSTPKAKKTPLRRLLEMKLTIFSLISGPAFEAGQAQDQCKEETQTFVHFSFLQLTCECRRTLPERDSR